MGAFIVALLALFALVAAVAGQANFDTRVNSTQLFLYTFENSQCQTGSFTDRSALNLLGGMSYATPAWTATDKCPTYIDPDGTTFRNAFNGVRSQGQRVATPTPTPDSLRDDATTSANDMTGILGALTSSVFTMEFWIVPQFSSGSTSNKYVLFEIGDSVFPSAGSNFVWACNGRNHDLQILYDDNAGAQQFSVQYRRGPIAANCQTITFDPTPLSQGELYHVAINSFVDSNQKLNLTLRSSSSLFENQQSTGISNAVSFPDWESTQKVRIGASPATLSTNLLNLGTFHSWNGDILLAAMHSAALTPAQILTNFNAKLPNSRPATALAPVVFEGAEDVFTQLDLAKFVFDFDVFWGFPTAAITYVLQSNTSGGTGSGGEFEVNDLPAVFPLPDDIEAAKLEYRNKGVNEYGANGTTFQLRGRDQLGVATTASTTVDVRVAPTNDAPTAIGMEIGSFRPSNTAQASRTVLKFAFKDLDCDRKTVTPTVSPTQVTDNAYILSSCTNLGQIVRIEVAAPTTDLGKLYLPTSPGVCDRFDNSTMTAITTAQNYTAADTLVWKTSVDIIGNMKNTWVELCFEGCLSFNESVNECPPANVSDALLGTANFSYSGQDNAGAISSGVLFTDVTNVLEVEENTFARIYEGNELYVTLVGRDNFCETVSSPLCPRAKSFVLGPLPDPSVGSLYLDSDTSRSTRLVDGQVLVPPNNDNFTLVFRAAPGYFNMDHWPLCGGNPSGAGQKELSRCFLNSQSLDDFECEGPDCGTGGIANTNPLEFNTSTLASSYTTLNLMGQYMGGCTTLTEDGCPVKINYALRVGGLNSASGAGVQVWVRNINDPPVISLPAATLPGVKKAESTPVQVNGTFIQIIDLDGDNRVMDLIVESPQGRGRILFPGLASTAVLGFTTQSGQIAGGGTQLGLRGSVTSLNLALRSLQYQLPGAAQTDIIRFYVNDVTRDASISQDFINPNTRDPFYQVIADLNVEIVLDTETEDFTVAVVVLWSSIVGGSLLCLGCCYGVLHAIFRRALMGERAALWFVRNVLLTHVAEHPEDKDGADVSAESKRASRLAMRRIHAERVTMGRVRCCVHFFACLCPCCCKFDPKNSMPSEGDMLAAATLDIANDVARKHVPTKDNTLYLTSAQALKWELHEHTDPRTGKVRPFLFNPHDGRSVWKWVITDQEED